MAKSKRPPKRDEFPGLKERKSKSDISAQGTKGILEPDFQPKGLQDIINLAKSDQNFATKLITNFDAEVQILGLNVNEAKELKIQLGNITKGYAAPGRVK